MQKLFLRFYSALAYCYAERCTSYSKSVRPSVRLSVTRWPCQNDSSYDHAVFTV